MIFRFENTDIYYEINEFLIDKNKNYNVKTNIPILFLHGWGGSLLSFKYFFDKMSRKSPCVILDFPPFGKSEKLKDVWTIKKYAKMVECLLSFLKIDTINIVAHSFGGRVALEMAGGSNIKVEKMLLTGCAGLKNRSFKTKLKILKYKFLKKIKKIKIFSKIKLENFGSSDYKELNPNMKKTFSNIVNYDQRYLLKEIKASVLLFWGKMDKETPFCFTKTFKKHIKDCEVVSVAEAGHFAYLDRPQLFLSIMRAFL